MAKEPPFADTGRETGAQVVVSDLDRLRFDPAEEMPDHLARRSRLERSNSGQAPDLGEEFFA